MDILIGIILLATLTQFLVDRIKQIIPFEAVGKFQLAPIWATAIGILIAIIAQVDIIAALGFQTNDTIGQIITGLVISGGSTAVHELIAKLRESRTGGDA